MPDTIIRLTQSVANREIAIYGEEKVRRMIVRSFSRIIRDIVAENLVLSQKMTELVSPIDYSLPTFQFSEQFGMQYQASLIIMTPEELEAHDRELCQRCNFDSMAYDALMGAQGNEC